MSQPCDRTDRQIENNVEMSPKNYSDTTLLLSSVSFSENETKRVSNTWFVHHLYEFTSSCILGRYSCLHDLRPEDDGSDFCSLILINILQNNMI